MPGLAHTERVDEDGYRVITYDPPSEEVTQAAIREAAVQYKRVFGERFAGVWLFGSRSRGDHRPDSDADLLVVLHNENPPHSESRLLCSVANRVRDLFGVFVDGHTTTLARLESSDDDFHFFIRTEGQRLDV